MNDANFQSWTSYFGLLYEDTDQRFPSRVFGFENFAASKEAATQAAGVTQGKPAQPGAANGGATPAANGAGVRPHPPYRRCTLVPREGACYGFVASGLAAVVDAEHMQMPVPAGCWFSTPNGCSLTLAGADTSVFVSQRLGYLGVFTLGGPIEDRGRLRYIDGCSDSLLVAPPILGDPCLNHLHFPADIDQTLHTHPSLRAGVVVRGRGWCVTPKGKTPLTPGTIFVIPTDAPHKFMTEAGESMDVVPYHPDSDWGPTHEEHPMVNRTLVEGRKIDNTVGRHAEAELVDSSLIQ